MAIQGGLKEKHNSFKKWPLNLWWNSNKTIKEVENITKAVTFKSFHNLSYKNSQLLFLRQCFLIFSWEKTLTNDFWGLPKNRNCAFPWNKKEMQLDLCNICSISIFNEFYFYFFCLMTLNHVKLGRAVTFLKYLKILSYFILR